MALKVARPIDSVGVIEALADAMSRRRNAFGAGTRACGRLARLA